MNSLFSPSRYSYEYVVTCDGLTKDIRDLCTFPGWKRGDTSDLFQSLEDMFANQSIPSNHKNPDGMEYYRPEKIFVNSTRQGVERLQA
jgi:hypothetical protein